MMSSRIDPSHRPSPYRELGWVIAISVAAHLLVFALFAGDLLPRRKLVQPPAIRVNLAHRPVERPQAGRPDAASGSPTAKPARPAEPPKAALPTPKPEAKLIPKPPAPKPPEPKPTPKPEPKKPEAKKPDPKAVEAEKRKAAEKARDKRLAEMRKQLAADNAQRERDQKIKALKDKLASMTSTNPGAASAGADAPVGEIGGKGDQTGISFSVYVGETIKSNWRLSKYQVSARDLKAVAKVLIAPDGNLSNYDIVRGSGNSLFDESVRKAILLSRKIEGYSRPQPAWYEIEFNLSDLED